MRLIATLVLFAGCTDTALDDDRAYRRLTDRFDTYDACLADKTAPSCYDTLTLCANQRVFLDIDNRPVEGSYQLEGHVASMRIEGDVITFDTQTLTSSQMPGRHRWELATPSFYGCDVRDP